MKAIFNKLFRGSSRKAIRRVGHRLSIDPRSKDFRGVKRRILLCMPSDSMRWQQEFYNQTFGATDLKKNTGIVVQVGSRINGRDGFPEYGFDPEAINAYEAGSRSFADAWSDGPFEGLFYDHEPNFVNDEGRTERWSGRRTYTDADAAFMGRVLEELQAFGVPMSQYGVPRVPKTSAMDFFHMRGLVSSRPLLDGCSWVQLNYYPSTRWATGDRIDAETEAGIRASVRRSVRFYRAIFPDKQIVPILFARYGNIANRHLFSILLDEFDKCKDIKSICYWTNPHSDNGSGDDGTSAMTRVYAQKFHEVESLLQKWVLGS